MYLYVKLLVAVFWLLVGGSLIFWQWIQPGKTFLTLGNTGISAGWLAILLALYNFIRWWSGRSYLAQRRAWEEAEARRFSHRHHRERQAAQEPNPLFDFSDNPSPSKDDDPDHR